LDQLLDLSALLGDLILRGMAMAHNGVPKKDDWRSIATQIQVEPDPEKVIELAKQLVARFDQQSSRQGQAPESDRR